MDILENNIYNNINGYIVSENIYLNKGKIFKVYTDEFGLISIYTKNIEIYFSLYSNYNFKLNYRNDFFSTQIIASISTIGLFFLTENFSINTLIP